MILRTNAYYQIVNNHKLSKRQVDVLCLYYGLEYSPKTLEEIGAEKGVTRERIRQIRNMALIRLPERLCNELKVVRQMQLPPAITRLTQTRIELRKKVEHHLFNRGVKITVDELRLIGCDIPLSLSSSIVEVCTWLHYNLKIKHFGRYMRWCPDCKAPRRMYNFRYGNNICYECFKKRQSDRFNNSDLVRGKAKKYARERYYKDVEKSRAYQRDYQKRKRATQK